MLNDYMNLNVRTCAHGYILAAISVHVLMITYESQCEKIYLWIYILAAI